ncbi:MAG: DUF935 domain-containing protein [Proteobacteria bacterium]|nr:DUF935 domain-containing protein [Pseudomonadota bacterium]
MVNALGPALRDYAALQLRHVHRQRRRWVNRIDRIRLQARARVLQVIRPRPLPSEAPSGVQTPSREGFGNPEWGLTADRLAVIFANAEQTGDLAEMMEVVDGLIQRDPHARNVYWQRRRAVAGKPYVIKPGGPSRADRTAARMLADDLRQTPGLMHFFDHQLKAVQNGVSASGIAWERNGRRVVPARFHPTETRRFAVATEYNDVGAQPGELLVKTVNHPQGERLRPGGWAVTWHDPGTHAARAALGRTTAWYTLFKTVGMRELVIKLVRFGVPKVLLKIENWEDEEAKAVAQRVLEQLGTDSGGVMHGDLGIEKLDAPANDNGIFQTTIAICNQEVSKAVYGVTLANESGSGGGAAYALGRTHAGIRFENLVADAVLLQDTFAEHVSLPWTRFNNIRAMPPVLRIHVVQILEPEAVSKLADVLVNKLGLRVDKQQILDMIGVREAETEEQVIPGKAGGRQ